MKLTRIKAIARKEGLQIIRDPYSLGLAFGMPIVLLIIFGYAITFDVNDIRVVIRDRDRSSVSRELVREMTSSGYFTVAAYIDDDREMDRWLERGGALAAVTIPADFSKNIRRGLDASAGLAIDGSDSNTATIAAGYLAGLTERFAVQARGFAGPSPIEVRSRVWYNPELKSRNYIVPGLIALIMSVIVALLTSLTVAREWERGTMEQLISTPVRPAELILGKLAPYFVIGLADMMLSVFMGTVLLGVPLRGNPGLLLAESAIFLFGGVALGILISIAGGGSQVAASQMAMLGTFLPAFLLSGFMFSIANMPKPLQLVTFLVPSRYFVTILKGIFLKGSTLATLWLETVLLAGFGGLVFVVALKKLKKRLY